MFPRKMEEDTETWQQTCRRLLDQYPVGLEDMTELTDVSDHSIAENLKIRLMTEQIYTYIGRVLIAVNPFKRLDIYDKRYVDAYHHFSKSKRSNNSQALVRADALRCSTAELPSMMSCKGSEMGKELPPHIYALTDNMYENMMIEKESQCVIISGESGAGKTISAKYIMSYLSEVASGGTKKIEEIKNIIVQSNPLLEAFGNAKTLRNNNSSRFGKFVEILFNMAGQPDGGKISNFLLEKSRVVSQSPGERNYHVFYQLLRGCSEEHKEKLGLVQTDPEEYYYLNRTGGFYDLPDMDDNEEFRLTMNAMGVVGLSEELQINVLQIVAAILHLGNIQFVEENNVAEVENPADLVTPSQLLGIDSESLKEKLVSRLMEARWGGKVDIMMMTLDSEQAMVSRDALAKALYAQLFDFLVSVTNSAMRKEKIELCIGVLDIYGFEIFETNGFEQFCINFVNEKLQQVFVELTLKNEQEEYNEEGITWTPIKFFNNKTVCDLIECKTPPGIMSVLDDVCHTVHAAEGSDRTLMEKLKAVVGCESSYSRHFRGLSTHFEIHHYAGKVHYEAKHFCEKNKDVLFDDVILLLQSSESSFIRGLFSDMSTSSGKRGRSSTGSSKIRAQCQNLIDRIMACTPHYVRCLKPSETKEPLDWHDHRILPQISYLGLRENIDVRRAGYAFRRIFDKMIDRYDIILSKNVTEEASGDKRKICEAIMEAAKLSPENWKIGLTKVFMKESDMITKLEQARSDALFQYAAKIQSIVRGYLARQYCKRLREQVRACKVIQRAFRRHDRKKPLNYRILVKQHLRAITTELEQQSICPESPETSESPETAELPEAAESPPLLFTHTETIDHAGYCSSNDLQNLTGKHGLLFACGARLFSKNLKMEQHVVLFSLYRFYVVEENAVVKYELDYNDLQALLVSVLETEFLVLQMQPFDLILESSHKNSLIAYLLAATSTIKEQRPRLEKSDEISVSAESGKQICLKFVKQGWANYNEPLVSNSGNELTVKLPDPDEPVPEEPPAQEESPAPEEVVDEGQSTPEVGLVTKETTSGSDSASDPIRPVVREKEVSFSINMEFGHSGGKVLCKGFEIFVPEGPCVKQTATLEIFYEPPSPSYLVEGEILLSPFIVITDMAEEETELRLKIPFQSAVPEDIETMAKWIRFYGALSEGVDPIWRDIKLAEDLDAFMVEIRDDHAKLHTQENITFCVLGSRDEEPEIYDYGLGLEYTTYGEYTYDYTYGGGESEYAANYGEQEYGGNYGEYFGENSGTTTAENGKFGAAGAALDKALNSPMPRQVLGMPPPVPPSNPPPRPHPSPFDKVPMNEKKGKEKKSKDPSKKKSSKGSKSSKSKKSKKKEKE